MRTLIIGCLEGYMTTAAKILMEKGIKISHVDSDIAALSLLRGGQGADLIFMDICENILGFMGHLRDERIVIPVVACGVGTVNRTKIVDAIQAGAKEYLPLPPEPALIAAVLETVSNQERSVIFEDAKTGAVFALAGQIARSEASVLITGESGTGKEIMARYIHRKSRRRDKKFVSINCAAIPENLLESELFGHEKGAFTGAVARRIGKFEEANGGTLLLDEISEMHPRLQAKLLRAIQEREIDRLGGGRPVRVDIRLLATSNRDLLKAVKEGLFREDLYFRLNVVNIELPPLRERLDDLPALALYFIEKYARANGLSKKSLSKEALENLKNYPWPGNIRELENTMHRAILLCPEEVISPGHLYLNPDLKERPFRSQEKEESSSSQSSLRSRVGQTLFNVEKALILETLDHCLGNRTQTARTLGISIRTLRNKLRQYGDEDVREERDLSEERALREETNPKGEKNLREETERHPPKVVFFK